MTVTDRDPVVGPRENLLRLLEQRVTAHAEVRLLDNRVVEARHRLETLEEEQRDAWAVCRVLSVQIDDAADDLYLPPLSGG